MLMELEGRILILNGSGFKNKGRLYECWIPPLPLGAMENYVHLSRVLCQGSIPLPSSGRKGGQWTTSLRRVNDLSV